MDKYHDDNSRLEQDAMKKSMKQDSDSGSCSDSSDGSDSDSDKDEEDVKNNNKGRRNKSKTSPHMVASMGSMGFSENEKIRSHKAAKERKRKRRELKRMQAMERSMLNFNPDLAQRVRYESLNYICFYLHVFAVLCVCVFFFIYVNYCFCFFSPT